MNLMVLIDGFDLEVIVSFTIKTIKFISFTLFHLVK